MAFRASCAFALTLGTRPNIMKTASALSSFSPSRKTCSCLVVSLGMFLCACGGGGSQGPPPPPAADFSLALNPASISISQGGSGSTSLSATVQNGFSSQITVQVTGLPAGVSVSPANITLTPGTPQQVTLSATGGAAAATATAVFTGTSGSLSHNASLSLAVTKGFPQTLNTRTRYVRTDAVTEYYQWVNTHWIIYSQPTSHFFVTDPFSNQIFVIDAASQKQIASIPVPGAFGIDDTPDHTMLYVGTLVGDVYSIDPVAMQVKRRYIASQIGPYGYQAFSAQVLSDGRVALLGAQGGIPSVDGSTSIAIWNPTDNSITIYGGVGTVGVPTQPLCQMGNIGAFTRSADRTAVFVGSIDSDNTLCEINLTTGQRLSAAIAGSFATTHIFTSPDGRYLAFPVYSGQVAIYDAHTLNQVVVFNVAGDTSSAVDLVFSEDSSTLFVPDASLVYAYDVTTHQQIGWFPNIVVEYTSGGRAVGPATNPIYEAGDGTGLLCGPLEEGFGCADTTRLQTGPVGTMFANAFLNPLSGPTSGGTVVQWQEPPTVSGPTAVYFGTTLASSISAVNGNLSATSPPGGPGPVNVYVFSSDGGMQLIADGFSYGPTILQVTPDNSSAEGGGVGVIYGYGFVPVTATTIPPGLSVTVAGQPATILGFDPNAYNVTPIPYVLQSIFYTIPGGTAGSSVDVTVTTSAGSATAHNGLAYLPAAKQFPLAGSALAQGIYDPVRDVYYFTDANLVQVFSLTQGKWLTPISIPAPTGKTQRLWGISLSPDGGKLAVADPQAGVVYLVDPANTSSVRTFSVTPPNLPQGIIVNPAGVAISDAGIIYLTTVVEGGTGFHNFYKLDTNTGALTDYGIDGPGLGGSDVYLRTTLSSDNTRAFFNDLGYIFSIDTATNTIFSASTDPGCCYGDYDLTLSKNQIQFEATSYLYDSDLNARSFFTLNDREIQNISYVYGAKLSPDGSLLFQPSTNGIDVYDGRLGTLRNRIALPFALSTNYDALVVDGKDNILLGITGTNGNGIAIVDLTSVAEPAPLPYVVAMSSQGMSQAQYLDRSGDLRKSRQETAKTAPVFRPRVPHVTKSILFRK